MSPQELKHRFLEFRRRLYGDHDLEAIDEFIHPDFVSASPLVLAPGREAYKDFVRGFHTGVPDLRTVTQHVIAEEDRLMSMTDWEATHSGAFLGVPATGQRLHFSTADCYEFRDGLIFRHWDVVDRLSASVALGLLHKPT